MTNRILIVEDEDSIRMSVADALRAEGFEVLEAVDGITGERMALRDDPALVLLDLMLPGRDGFSVLRNLREDRLAVPIIVATARGEEFDRIQGFEFGADDYVVKPFSIAELLLRIRALIARSGGGAPGVPGSSDRARFGETEVDFGAFTVRCAGRQSALSRRELELLDYFLRFEGETLDRFRLLSDVWGPLDDPTVRTVDQHVLKLRKKIEPDPANPRHLITVRGVGYRFTRAAAVDQRSGRRGGPQAPEG